MTSWSLLLPVVAGCLMAASPIEILSGVTANQVIQQDREGRGLILLRGRCAAKQCAGVEARVLDSRGVLRGFSWTPISAVSSGAWEGRLERIPAGGPYRIELRARGVSAADVGVVSVDSVLVGDLWVLAGQSNMHGRGELAGAEAPDEHVHNFDLADRWSVAVEPVGDSLEAIDPAHWAAHDAQERPRPYTPEEVFTARQDRTRGASSAMTFAKRMAATTGVPIGLIPCARGATSLEKWSPAGKAAGPVSLYGSMLQRCMAVGGRIRGVLWYQGESDAIEGNATGYGARFQDFIRSLRADLGDPELPVYYVQIGRFVAPDSPGWNNVQLAQLDTEAQIPHVAVVPAIDLRLLDEIHIDIDSLKRVGRRLANLACADLYPKSCASIQKGPRPVAVRIDGPAGDRIAVTFSGVNGRLAADGRVSGFSIRDPQGADLLAVNDMVLDTEHPLNVVLRVKPHVIPKSGATLWYGWGNNPNCNLRDEKDMATPVFAWPLHLD